MKHKIGFVDEFKKEKNDVSTQIVHQPKEVRKSLVRVYFAKRVDTYTYYNDAFDLKPGDFVYVDGKLAGEIGRVVEVEYNFKIKLSDYHKVIYRVDNEVHGEFYADKSYFVTFDRYAIPQETVSPWFVCPCDDEDVIVSTDDKSYNLEAMESFGFSLGVIERGREYYFENRVKYIYLDGTRGYAAVEGSEGYEVEFEYNDGCISKLVCSCPCGIKCKHEYAAIALLDDILKFIKEKHKDEYEKEGYFAAILKEELFYFSIDGRQNASFLL